MLMSVIEGARSAPAYPELAGRRVLITGVTSSCGVDIVRAFADHRTRLILQFAEESENMQAIAEIAAPTALEIKAFGPLQAGATEEAVQFARTAVAAFGGLEAVINLIPLSIGQLDPAATRAEIERMVADRLLVACVMSKVAANRMALALTEGLILNIAVLAKPALGTAQAFAGVVKAALAAMTRSQAEEWALKGIRFNAIAPQAVPTPAEPALGGEPDIAALALYLASGRGKALSGHLFEAEPAKAR